MVKGSPCPKEKIARNIGMDESRKNRTVLFMVRVLMKGYGRVKCTTEAEKIVPHVFPQFSEKYFVPDAGGNFLIHKKVRQFIHT
jgi:hypothetical protein